MLFLPSRRGSVAVSRALIASLCAGLLVAGNAAADPPARFERMADELRNNEDFRVRTQAALALGASKEKRAVPVLCDGLDDTSTTVRAAAAAALGKLLLGGVDCMKSHLASETAASVKTVLIKSIDAMKSSTSRPTTPITVETKYYVAIGPTIDKTGRTGTAVDDMVHGAAEEAASNVDGLVVAPRTETSVEGKVVVSKWKKLKAFFLWPKVQQPDYSGGNLTVRVELTVFTYPGKAMMGTIPMKLTMTDVSSTDRDSENQLIRTAAGKALVQFANNADRFAQ